MASLLNPGHVCKLLTAFGDSRVANSKLRGRSPGMESWLGITSMQLWSSNLSGPHAVRMNLRVGVVAQW